MQLMTKKINGKERTIEEEIFDKSSDQISRLVNSLSAKSILAGEKLVATYSIST